MTTITAVDHQQLLGTYDIDATHSRIGFVVRHAMITNIRGEFVDFTGTAGIAASPEDSFANISILADSVTSLNKERDEATKSERFLNVEAFPTVEFLSTSISVRGDTYRIVGDFTLCGVTRELTLDFSPTGLVTDNFGVPRAGFEASASILRSDFGLTTNSVLDAGGVMISDRVTLEFDISAIKKS